MPLPKFDWKHIDWFSPKPSKERMVIGVAVIAVLALIYWAFSPGSPASTGGIVQRDNALVSVGPAPSGPIPLQSVGKGQCTAQTPQGWRVTDTNEAGTVFSLASADGGEIASYGAIGVNGGQAAGLYGDQFRSPETLILYIANTLSSEQAQIIGQNEQIGPYQIVHFATQTRTGYALFLRTSIPTDPNGYGLIVRVALGRTGEQRSLGMAGAVAAAARCSAIVIPHQTVDYEPQSDKSHGAGKSSCNSEQNCDDTDLAGTYNSQLGTGYAHDGTGRNYLVDTTNGYTSGPEGDGYYSPYGKRLTPGLQ